MKSFGRQEFVIGGWLPGKGRRRESIGALLLGVYEPDGTLRYVGRVDGSTMRGTCAAAVGASDTSTWAAIRL